MTKGTHSSLAIGGAMLRVRATPRARRPALDYAEGIFRIAVTAPAEEGRANAAVMDALAHALGVAKTRLTLVNGATARDKLFRLD